MLEKVDVRLRSAQETTSFVKNIDYDAKGHRTLIEYGNGVKTIYEYDPLTFRLTHLQTLRGAGRLQDVFYTYDPTGNVTHIRDDAQQVVYFNNQVVTPDHDATYDAIYRLIKAEGREHIGQASRPQTTWDDRFRVRLPHPGEGQAMRRYAEQYQHDAVGNFLQLTHQAASGNWSRSYAYNEPSPIEPGKHNNRLSATVIGNGNRIGESYRYDEHGNVLALSHLPIMDWDSGNHLQHVNMAGGGDVYYVYDASGQRMRKIVEKNGGLLIDERIYLGSFEIFRRRNKSGTVTLERETLHVMDDTQRIALVETRTRGNDGSPAQLIRFQFGNHLRSVSLELDLQARIISYEEYYPYGSTSYQAVRSRTETPKRYRYTGMERDEETGLSYHSARYYSPWLGRWLSPDPSGLKDGLNLFSYSRQNPVIHTDRNGRETAAEMLKADKQKVESFHETIDVDRNHHITANELLEGFQNSRMSYETWWSIAYDYPGDYTFDPSVEKLLERRSTNPHESNETALRYNSKGGTYTNREGREATKRWLNRHKDPDRLLLTVKTGAAILAPEYYFTARSIYHSATGNPKEAITDLGTVLVGKLADKVVATSGPTRGRAARAGGARAGGATAIKEAAESGAPLLRRLRAWIKLCYGSAIKQRPLPEKSQMRVRRLLQPSLVPLTMRYLRPSSSKLSRKAGCQPQFERHPVA